MRRYELAADIREKTANVRLGPVEFNGGRVQPGVAVPWGWRILFIEGRRPKGPCFQGPFGTLVATPYYARRRSSIGPILGTLLPITAVARMWPGCVPGTRTPSTGGAGYVPREPALFCF